MSTRRALTRLRALDPNGAYDYNHIYLDSSVVTGNDAAPGAAQRSARAEEGGARRGAADEHDSVLMRRVVAGLDARGS